MSRKEEGKTRSGASSRQDQRAYAQALAKGGFDYNLMVADAFIRGIRDIGYKSTGTALDELVDNSIQAGATNIHVAFGHADGSAKKIASLAVIDNGHGMDPEMLRAAVLWGGTHREGDRTGFGRYGYGLPSSCVSIGRRFTVYSWHEESNGVSAVTVDVDDIGEGKYNDKNGRVVVPPPKRTELPAWLADYLSDFFPGGIPVSGTVVMIEKLDRINWNTSRVAQEKLLELFGITYRNYLRQISLSVNGRAVEPVDPLFLMPGAKFYGEEHERAVGMDDTRFEVKDSDSGHSLGFVKVRYSYLPVEHFGERVNGEDGVPRKNPRYEIMRQHNGIIVLRQGRQIDVLSRCPWTTFQNNDRFIKVEVDFPPTMDEFFSVTTSKQQVGLVPAIWDRLKEAGVYQAIQQMRKTFKEDKAVRDARAEVDENETRPSEEAMMATAKFKSRRPGGDAAEREKKAQETFRRHAEQKARAAGIPFEVIERELEIEIQGRPFKVEEESNPGAPFYRVERRGGQVVLVLNAGHRFYTDVYSGPDSTPRLRAALEVLLFVMGECELDSNDDRRLFYESERGEWSKGLNIALDRLSQIDRTDDRQPEDVIDFEQVVDVV